MLRHSPLCLLLLPLLVNAAPPKDEFAYSLGVQLGERLQQEVPGIALDDLLEGLRQGYRGEKPSLSHERMAAVLAAHDQPAQEASSKPDSGELAKAAERRFLANEKARYGVHELTGGVLVSELRAGHGASNPQLREARVNYIGTLADGNQFDASNSPQWFRIDAIIPGWRTALRAMPVGARWRVVVPSAQAYGSDGAEDLIPPHAPLVFEIELLESR
ncbi:FKBP-type peptidyl-prolyl cis-trans isomerase [Pseudomonas sp. ZM23]|uniref:Peptidyl-prolyl cis-trans isomerase n=1 Tax=Pseudomonas triclosanedens TaxID=2961893 RepID=A0ABY7A1C8_9PSED|nr:FKBP-type peptidyl-prolyl cis-trans isomerase [Pseudomonas triclosanedens]MCP8462817.1 FKBP-type peptidyl-prolyl cis-trans isomerase [Pseudomonas triclosanedens]MCP8468437.1 FKBP-type peptidyl-prolyl cis-trans isomerase [Pseudomonas triclosanedens]MCP8475158.1 FKBP-type peptidyl-prolyl cis-trans isomerase [Pseudomonas triclosanedens]WAI49998.1 FKBP-type peptidyl-prolyl cis-trans isomerase [Pseudomonas triclosanedens]